MFKLAEMKPRQGVVYEDIDLTLGPEPENKVKASIGTPTGTVEFSQVDGKLEICDTEEEYQRYKLLERMRKDPTVKLCNINKR